MAKRLRKVSPPTGLGAKVFRLMVIIAFFVLVIALAFLMEYIMRYEYIRYTTYIIILTILLAVGYKKGYEKQFSPKQRKLVLVVIFGLETIIIIFALLRLLGWY